VSWPIQDHADALLALLSDAPGGPPALVVCDGHVDDGVTAPYALAYITVQAPDGTTAPELLSLTYASTAINVRATIHSVGATAMAARAVAGRVSAALLDMVPAVSGRSCFPIRWLDGQPTSRDEEAVAPVFGQVDVYGWTSVPG
jgi:hypothetical protein